MTNEFNVLTTTQIKATQITPEKHETMEFGGYNWLILDKQDGKALLLSENILSKRPYHPSNDKTKWESCKLREYLNDEFYNTFNEVDKSRIMLTNVVNTKNPWYGFSGGNDTDDYVFLLSVNEVIKYFGDSGDLAARKGWYWNGKINDFEFTDGLGQLFIDQYSFTRRAKDTNGNPASWWTRSPGRRNGLGISIEGDFDGNINIAGTGFTSNSGIRPAMWVTFG